MTAYHSNDGPNRDGEQGQPHAQQRQVRTEPPAGPRKPKKGHRVLWTLGAVVFFVACMTALVINYKVRNSGNTAPSATANTTNTDRQYELYRATLKSSGGYPLPKLEADSDAARYCREDAAGLAGGFPKLAAASVGDPSAIGTSAGDQVAALIGAYCSSHTSILSDASDASDVVGELPGP